MQTLPPQASFEPLSQLRMLPDPAIHIELKITMPILQIANQDGHFLPPASRYQMRESVRSLRLRAFVHSAIEYVKFCC